MEGPGATTNANVLHKSLRSIKSHILEHFRNGEVSSGMPTFSKALWERGSQPPPFKVDEPFAVVDFVNAVLDGSVGTRIQHS
eukprot:2946251-Pleurochrysis_carterae.AAC.1